MQPSEAIDLAKSLLAKRIGDRESNFLVLLEKAVYGYSKSPYLPLLRRKKIAFHNVKTWVENDGLERTLQTLAADGVFFTVDEFKGRVPVQRPGISFGCNPRMFDNPF